MPGELATPGALDLLRAALQDGFVVAVYRNEVREYADALAVFIRH